MITAIGNILSDAFYEVSSLSWERTLRVFWLFFLFDFPRYIMTDIFIFFYEIADRFRKKKNVESFALEMKERPPLVSVIVPVLNEEDTIEWTIRSMKEQTYKNLEIIIVDDGSTDRTPEICKSLKKLGGVSYHRFSERAGKAAALNYALGFAKGKYAVFVDSDTTFDRDAVFNLIKGFADPRVGAVAGNLRPRNTKKSLLTTLQHIEYLFSISMGRRIRALFGILPVISGAFGGFRRDIVSLEAIGGHDPGPGNDSDLTIRVRKLGYKIAFAPEANAMCLTNVPETFYGLIKQRLRWDRNLIKNRLRKHKDVYNPFSKNFKLKDVISFTDTIFFHVGLAVLTVVYVTDLLLNYPQILPFIFFTNYILYFSSELFQLLLISILSKRWDDLLLAVYMPIYNPYKIILKFFRLVGYAQELFFRYSYFGDRFAPFKVRQRMIKW